MSEQLTTSYKTLFQVHIFHHYWLDNGATLFDQLAVDTSVANFQGRPLNHYDARQFLSITPTAATAKIFSDLGLIFKATALGFMVAMPQDAVLSLDAQLAFVVVVKDASFFDYTALTLRQQKIYELYHPVTHERYRYKENVIELSNFTGTLRANGLHQSLYLSSPPLPLAADDKAEAIFLTANGFLMQLGGDMPVGWSTQISNNLATELPVFVHQGDIPVISSPAGLLGAPARGISLNEDIPDDTFALLRLHATRPSNQAFSLVDNLGKAKADAPVFQVRFKNRSTVWRYFDKSTGVFKEQQGPFALTYLGNPGSKQKPVAAPKIKRSGNNVVQLESEIFV